MSFNGTEGTVITYAAAHDLTLEYQENHSGSTKAFFFGKDHLQAILDQNDCMGIRIFYGQHTEGGSAMVLVGADASEDDQVTGIILDDGVGCPPKCGTPDNLNNN